MITKKLEKNYKWECFVKVTITHNYKFKTEDEAVDFMFQHKNESKEINEINEAIFTCDKLLDDVDVNLVVK